MVYICGVCLPNVKGYTHRASRRSLRQVPQLQLEIASNKVELEPTINVIADMFV